MAKQIALIKSDGGSPELEIQFGNANVAAYRVFLWENGRNPKQIGQGGSADCTRVRICLNAASTISYEAIIQSPLPGPNQPYSMGVFVYQDGDTVPGGVHWELGKLNQDGVKSVIGFIYFQLS